ncbi:MAG: heterodisulfide reductase-related iron-sulfur binding cluster [Isosphaeraceae bacterium]
MSIAPPETTNARPSATGQLSESPAVDLAWLAQRIDYRRFQDCVHCGLCTASCPTYVETANENDSPRGRIYLMRAVTDGRLGLSAEVRHHLNLCLDCRACESACPSGVKYGQIIEPFKIAIARATPQEAQGSLLQRWILHHLFPYPGRVKAALLPARVLQSLGLLDLSEKLGLTRLLPPTLRKLQDMLPKLRGRSQPSGQTFAASGTQRARVAQFRGCVADALFPETNAATTRVLQRNGCEVELTAGQVCCGAIHYHSGEEATARELARTNLRAFDLDSVDAIIVNAAGCGAMLKEYGHLFPKDDPDHARAIQFAAKVKDVSEFLMALGLVTPRHRMTRKVAYHDACHLCHAQQIRSQPRELLQAIPGLELTPLEESEICCGAAGTYNLTQPEMSDRLGQRKADFIEATGAEIVATGNVGCILQIARKLKERGDRVEVVHPVDLLDQCYRGPDVGT